MYQRLLFVSPSAYPLGGVAAWLDYLMPGLEAHLWRCTLGLVEGRHHLVEPYLSRHPWHDVRRICNRTGSREGAINAIARTISKVRPDIVVVANIVDTYAAIRRLRVEASCVPRVVMTLHGLQADLLADIRAEKDVLDAVVATNRLGLRLAAESLGIAKRAFYAPYGVPSAQDPGEPPVTQQGRLRLLYCGRIEQEQKRVLDLPNLLLQLRSQGLDCALSIAGSGPDEAALRKKIASLALDGQVHFLGVLDAEALATEYRRHDALVITSVWETGPIVAWEAMAHGLPVLTSRYVGSRREGALVDGANCLFFPVGDTQAAALAAARLVDTALRRRLAQGGFALVRARYTRETSIAQWAAAFEGVMALPPRSKPAVDREPLPSGRLDRVFGARLGEHLRRALGISFVHEEAGGEWPHSGARLARPSQTQAIWLAHASELDVET